MKEAFWGVLIIILGLLGIVIVNLFQEVTVDNDRVYYLIKESTEAAAFDAIDLTYYRLNGDIRIVEDKFVENLTRRFAENVTIGDYTIIIEDINEIPPKISLRIRSGVSSIRGETFGIVNDVNSIIEVKYSLDEVLNFLGITEEEWNNRVINTVDSDSEGMCKLGLMTDADAECMPGDLMFTGFSNSSLSKAICQDETAPRNVARTANYKVCNCGKWEEESETVYANPVSSTSQYTYTWNFNKTGEIRNISESSTSKVARQICTTAIGVMVPQNPDTIKGTSNEPSTDNSKYINCPTGGIRIPLGTQVTLHPNYIPPLSVNRNLTWTVGNSDILGILSSNPPSTCALNSTGSNCFSIAKITAKTIGQTAVNVRTTRNQTATCNVSVWDGSVDSVGCTDTTINYNGTATIKATYTPANATQTNFTWSVDNTTYATIDSTTGKITGRNNKSSSNKTVTVTVTAPNGKTGTCKITVKGKTCATGYLLNTSTGNCDPKKITVTFNRNYGSKTTKTQTFTYGVSGQAFGKDTNGKYIYSGSTSTKFAGWTRSGYTMLGWALESNAKTARYKIYSGVNNDFINGRYPKVELYAVWEKESTNTVSVGGSTGGGSPKCPSYTVSDDCVKAKRDFNTNAIILKTCENESTTYSNGSISYGVCTGGKRKVYCSGSRTRDLLKRTWQKEISTESCGGTTDGKIANTIIKSSKTSGSISSGKTGGCFLAGTQVLTNKGKKDIDKIQIGDIVLSYNEDTGINEYNKVLNVYVHENLTEDLYTLTFDNSTLKVTESHRFYIEGEWIAAKDLKIGDKVMYADGTYHTIKAISYITESNTVYNFEVENNHNYYVGDKSILVHNIKVRVMI